MTNCYYCNKHLNNPENVILSSGLTVHSCVKCHGTGNIPSLLDFANLEVRAR